MYDNIKEPVLLSMWQSQPLPTHVRKSISFASSTRSHTEAVWCHIENINCNIKVIMWRPPHTFFKNSLGGLHIIALWGSRHIITLCGSRHIHYFAAATKCKYIAATIYFIWLPPYEIKFRPPLTCIFIWLLPHNAIIWQLPYHFNGCRHLILNGGRNIMQLYHIMYLSIVT